MLPMMETQNVYDIIHDSHLIYTFFAFPLKCLMTYEMALCLSLKYCKWIPTSMCMDCMQCETMKDSNWSECSAILVKDQCEGKTHTLSERRQS